MGKLTRSGVAHNLEDSPHKLTIEYVNSHVTFIFSSELYMRLFSERMENNRQEINASLGNRFGFEISNNLLCDIKLYSSVEKRGFFIVSNDDEIHSPEELLLDGERIIKKEVLDPGVVSILDKIDAMKESGKITDEMYETMRGLILK